MNTTKAMLQSLDGTPDIIFMFNPQEIPVKVGIETADSKGARSDKGIPKVSYSNRKPLEITLKNIIFDTYEQGKSVTEEYISKFQQAIEFAPGLQRPPIYTFRWGGEIYIKRCFVQDLSFKYTMFLANGTPARAVFDSLTLKEAEQTNDGGGGAIKPKTSTSTDTNNNHHSDSFIGNIFDDFF